MSKKSERNPNLIHTVTEVLVVQTKSLPPRTFVIAAGENRTGARNPRLVSCEGVGVPETLYLDFEVDHGMTTEVVNLTAALEIELNGGKNQVTVHAKENSISQELPPRKAAK